ncbi:uncharacterized protein LOC131934955 [Physella acuta]|uniref:uncharacterized protein LOC131934955 n=1 Tax=Physella acuta TaxID=109671 RepID=UPI0027DC1A07|nr:uncharacterized protein LOC131934955 [Physella acuta]
MSATKVFFVLAIHLVVIYGLNVDMKRELFYQGRELFCAQLQCTENIREDTQISALVNMSVYVINEPGDKLMLASVSGSDSKARDYKVPGVFVNGNISHHGGELQLFLSNDSACYEKILTCEIYFTYKTGEIRFAEEQTASLRKENMRKSDLMLNLKAKTVNYVKTVDTMADFLKTFEDPSKLKGADMSMSLQMSHSSSDDNGFPRKNFTDTHKQIESSNSLQSFETRINNLTAQLQFVNERFNHLKDKRLNMNEENTEKEQNTNSLIWTKKMCKRTRNFNLTSRQLVQLNQSKLTLCDTKTDGGGWILILLTGITLKM